jgi:hypothetical protein
MNIYNLKTNYLMNPIGFLMDTVALSWIIEAPFEEELQGTRVLIALDENFEEVIHDSGCKPIWIRCAISRKSSCSRARATSGK